MVGKHRAEQSKIFRPGKRTLASTDALALSNSERAMPARPSNRDGAAEHTASSSDASKKKRKKHQTSKNSIDVKRTRLTKPSKRTSNETTHNIVNVDISPCGASVFHDILPDIEPPDPKPTTEHFTQDFLKDWNLSTLWSEENLPPGDANDDEVAAFLLGNSDISDGLPHDKPDYVLNGYAQPPPISKESSRSSDSGGSESSMERYNPGTPDTDDNYEFQKEAFEELYQRIREEQMEEGTGKTSGVFNV